ncbi:unnamed protein product [Caenorhabditis angaria]|uniref:Uncharacterized protein n=1 Tax=Caenorhabditis angaria TaxID=860376 RepID=A0A9P1J0P2_9PELO|nr:unnamed protein product [Caenorhabditis angaria]
MLRTSAAARNKEPILEVLKKHIRDGDKILEIASGCGEHIHHFAQSIPNATFQPSEADARLLHSIVGYIDNHQLPNVRVPLFIDVAKKFDQWALPEDYGPKNLNVVLNINMIHICSQSAIEGLFEAADILLNDQNGLLITYGPYSDNGVISPQSNIDFDEGLRSQNPEWGLKDVQYLVKLAQEVNLHLAEKVCMPKNNAILIFSR